MSDFHRTFLLPMITGSEPHNVKCCGIIVFHFLLLWIGYIVVIPWLNEVHLWNFFSYLYACGSHLPRRGNVVPHYQASAKFAQPLSEEDLQKLAREQLGKEEALEITKKHNSRISKFRDFTSKGKEVKSAVHFMNVGIHHLTFSSFIFHYFPWQFPEIMHIKNSTWSSLCSVII